MKFLIFLIIIVGTFYSLKTVQLNSTVDNFRFAVNTYNVQLVKHYLKNNFDVTLIETKQGFLKQVIRACHKAEEEYQKIALQNPYATNLLQSARDKLAKCLKIAEILFDAYENVNCDSPRTSLLTYALAYFPYTQSSMMHIITLLLQHEIKPLTKDLEQIKRNNTVQELFDNYKQFKSRLLSKQSPQDFEIALQKNYHELIKTLLKNHVLVTSEHFTIAKDAQSKKAAQLIARQLSLTTPIGRISRKGLAIQKLPNEIKYYIASFLH